MNRIATSIGLALLLTACDGLTGPGSGGNVAIRFSTATAPGISANLVSTDGARLASADLTLTGSNATLVIQDIRFIVSELKLRSSSNAACGEEAENEDDDANDDRVGADDEQDDCEFEGGPFLVDLPLDGNATITTEKIPAGTYDSFRFKIEDLEPSDDDDSADKSRIPAILAEVRSVYPNFPSGASMVVKGTQNGQPFTVYFDSHMKIKSALVPPLAVPGDKTLTVKIDPSKWFMNGNQVMNLLALNGRLVDFKSQFRGGVKGAHKGED